MIKAIAISSLIVTACGPIDFTEQPPVQTIPGNPVLHRLGTILDDVAGLPPIASSASPDADPDEAARASCIELRRVELAILPGSLPFPVPACWDFVHRITISATADRAPDLPEVVVAEVTVPACVETLVLEGVRDVNIQPYATHGLRFHIEARGVPPPRPIAFQPTLFIRAYP